MIDTNERIVNSEKSINKQNDFPTYSNEINIFDKINIKNKPNFHVFIYDTKSAESEKNSSSRIP